MWEINQPSAQGQRRGATPPGGGHTPDPRDITELRGRLLKVTHEPSPQNPPCVSLCHSPGLPVAWTCGVLKGSVQAAGLQPVAPLKPVVLHRMRPVKGHVAIEGTALAGTLGCSPVPYLFLLLNLY